jgi:hypothetical protein
MIYQLDPRTGSARLLKAQSANLVGIAFLSTPEARPAWLSAGGPGGLPGIAALVVHDPATSMPVLRVPLRADLVDVDPPSRFPRETARFGHTVLRCS